MAFKDVYIDISRETMAPTREGFGLPLILKKDSDEEYTLCSDTAAVEDAGFGTDTEVYEMANMIFSQNPSPPKVAVAGLELKDYNASAMLEADDGAKVKVYGVDDFSGSTGNDKNVEIVDNAEEGLDVSYSTDTITVDLGGEQASADDISGKINSLDNFEAYVEDLGYFTPEDDLQTVDFEGGEDSTLSGGLNELIRKHDDWYFLLCDTREEADIKELSEWAEANGKLYFAQPDKAVADAINDLQLNRDRTVIAFHNDTDYRFDAGWVGRCAPEDPGSVTWKFKNINGPGNVNLGAADVSSTDLHNLHTANMNTYVSKMGMLQTSEGLTTSGEYIDVIRGQDWVTARLKERVQRLLTISPKVPYTDRGINQVVAEVESVMKDATGQGIIARDEEGNGLWEVRAPTREETSSLERARRTLRDVKFEFELAGAIHEVHINGTIVV